jgi:hypothetical protein
MFSLNRLFRSVQDFTNGLRGMNEYLTWESLPAISHVNYDRLTVAPTGKHNWWTGLQVAAVLTDERGMSSPLEESEKSRWSRSGLWIGADVGFVWK